ncbi:RNA methyltransferase, TrmH family, group 3 [Emticicia oligotrophica DSM 17448]|uniref:RNA methyltransferase, TrmH family, group 3 n=1 Tax=Emticicia oligotrophica (strain DSM 17448 / CIP 109782 / MTCC 6937 / GPTSA100-15) TaxID=929562 RepID=A0ABM5N636_EMTOG|nr:23S rRNA (guanosine(2251)-2'-O)-methyltransferase RlmB [Emticicia oligotrophica]AFK04994.1 RNA methyltransferase, TrmH family, group 3 [Emticicia oligotrophica DSM 17448]
MENRKRSGLGRSSEGFKKAGSDSKPGQKKRYFAKPTPVGFEKPSKPDIVFGVQSVLETLKSTKEIEKILLQRDFGHAEVEKLAREREIPVQRVPLEKLNRVTMKVHQGVIAFVSAVNYAKTSNVVADTFEKGETPLLLVLDRITDVRNFGAIARTAECAGVNAIVVPARGAAQVNADAMKTSVGALNHLPVCRENSLSQVVSELQQSGIQVVACTEKANDELYEIDFTLPTAILMGSEEDGISDNLLEQADFATKIPMMGKIGSLNVSVATAIILYEAVRQRQNNK